MYEYTDILAPVTTEFGTFRVAAKIDNYVDIEPDYCGSDGFSETLLGWGGRPYTGWTLSWNTCEGHGDTCKDSHPIDPDTIRHAANELDDDYLERWLNICAPDGIKYRVSRVNGYSQGDVWLLVESYPATTAPSDLPDPEHNEAVNWARGDVHSLVVQEHDDDDTDSWIDVHHGYTVYGQSWDLPKMEHVRDYAEDCRDEYVWMLEKAKRKRDAQDADLVSGMI